MTITDQTKQIGTCSDKEISSPADIVIYLSNLDSDIATSTLDGDSITSPEINFMNAVLKALEKAAKYKQVKIFIYLYKGTHFILRNQDQ